MPAYWPPPRHSRLGPASSRSESTEPMLPSSRLSHIRSSLGGIEYRPQSLGEPGLDEKEVKIGGVPYYVWAAVDLDREEVVDVMVSQGRNCLEAYLFLRRVARLCQGRKPRVFVVRRLLEAAKGKDHVFLMTLLYTGTRDPPKNGTK